MLRAKHLSHAHSDKSNYAPFTPISVSTSTTITTTNSYLFLPCSSCLRRDPIDRIISHDLVRLSYCRNRAFGPQSLDRRRMLIVYETLHHALFVGSAFMDQGLRN